MSIFNLQKYGTAFRVVYLNFLFLTMAFLASLFAGVLNADYNGNARYKLCSLGQQDASGTATCPNADDADLVKMEALFGLSIAAAVFNALALVWSLLMHADDENGTRFKAYFVLGFEESMVVPFTMGFIRIPNGQLVLSVLNVALFGAIAGVMNTFEHLLTEGNLANNLYFSDNIYLFTMAVFALCAAIADVLVFQGLLMFVFGDKCRRLRANESEMCRRCC